MANDHSTAYHDYLQLVTYANPADTLFYARYADAEERRAYDAACMRAEYERELLDKALDDLLYYQQHQPGCVDFQWKIVTAQKEAVAQAEAAERATQARLEQVRKDIAEGRA